MTRLTRVLRRNVALLAVCLLGVPLAALVFSLLQEERYEASASLLFRDPGLDQKLFGSSLSGTENDPQRAAATNLQLISLAAVAQRTARSLDLPGLDARAVRASVTVEPRGESDVLAVKATDPSPRRAARIANAFAMQYIVFRRDADRAKVREAQTLVEQRLAALPPAQLAAPEGIELTRQARQLDVLASLQTGNAELVQAAEPPDTAASPKPARNVALGVLLGALLGAALVAAREQLDRRLKDPDDVQELFEEPILATAPESRLLPPRVERAALLSGPEVEAFAMLRTNLRFYNQGRELRSILITSPQPQDGKTVVAWNLATAEARAGTKVLYIEADLRRPALAGQLGISAPGGVAQVLAGELEPQEAVVRIGPIDAVLAGGSTLQPAELLGSQNMLDLLDWAETHYERVVIDTPPSVEVADAIPLMNQVSGLIVVIRLHRTSKDAAIALGEQVENVHAPVLGLVLNGSREQASSYYIQTPDPAAQPVATEATPPRAAAPRRAKREPGQPRRQAGDNRVTRRQLARLPSREPPK